MPSHAVKDKPIKVLHLIDSGGLYGAEKVLLNLVAEQVKQGNEPLILSATKKGEQERAICIEAKKMGLPILPWLMNGAVNIKDIIAIRQYAINNDYTILHSHGYKFNILMGVIPRGLRKFKLVTTIHGYTVANKFSAMWFYQLLDKLIVRSMSKIIFVSKASRLMPAFSRINDKKIKVIWNGIPVLKNINEVTLKKSSSEYFTYIAVGRLSAEKGFLLLIEAFNICYKNDPSVRLTIYGEGDEKCAIKDKIQELQLGEVVSLPGYTDNIPIELEKADVLVMPSFSEGFPVTLIEARMLGVVIVASAVGGIPELLKGYSRSKLVPPQSAKKLSEAMQIVKGDEYCARAVDVESLHILSSKNMSEKYTNMYRELISVS